MNTFIEYFKYSKDHLLVYNSVAFFGLFTFFYLLFLLASKKIPVRNILLLAFSLFFYYRLSGLFVVLMCFIAASDYVIGRIILATKNERVKVRFLMLSIFISVGSLLYFKYTGFILDLINAIFQTEIKAPAFSLLMPIGISFYVFKTLSYIFDCYNEVIEKPEKNYLTYLLYVSFFPNILAGPIAKARHLLPQFNSPTLITKDSMSRGFFLIMLGIVKKYLIADFLWNNFIERVFNAPTLFSGLENWIAMYMAAIQFYYDFSGYTDLVLGISLLLGFEIQNNFNRPFLAQNVTDLWRRWHITLSTWLSEYVFTPLNYSLRKYKKPGAVFASILTFVISGLWHGPKLTYVLWGTLHGMAIGWDVASQNWRTYWKKLIPASGYKFISIFITFHFIAFTIVLFDAKDIRYAFDMYSMMFTKTAVSLFGQWLGVYWSEFLIFAGALFIHFTPSSFKETLIKRFRNLHLLAKALLIFLVIIFVFQFYSAETQNFIYLKF